MTGDDIGARIALAVSFSDDQGNRERLTSSPTSEIESAWPYEVLHPPFNLAQVWWWWRYNGDCTGAFLEFETVTVDFTIHNDPNYSTRGGLFLMLVNGNISGKSFYFGLQTRLQPPLGRPAAKGTLFSRLGYAGPRGTPPPILTMDGRTTEDTRETSSAPVARMNGLPETTEPGWRAIAAGSPTPTASGMACGSRTSTRTSKHGLVRCGSHWWKAGHTSRVCSAPFSRFTAVRSDRPTFPAWHVSVGIPAGGWRGRGVCADSVSRCGGRGCHLRGSIRSRSTKDASRRHSGRPRRQTSQQLIFFPDRAGRVTLSSAPPARWRDTQGGVARFRWVRGWPAGSGRGG